MNFRVAGGEQIFHHSYIAPPYIFKQPFPYGLGALHIGNRIPRKDDSVHILKNHDKFLLLFFLYFSTTMENAK